MPDRYTYPGSEVLVNLRGYQDPALWKAAERRVVTVHMADLVLHPVHGNFDLRHLQAIHARLVAGFYSWGGKLRDTDTGPGGTGLVHCRPEFIPAEADRIFTAVAAADRLKGRDRDSFSRGLAWAWGEITAVHPFRDVNTRSQFTFFNQLAAEAGWLIDWSQIDPHVFAHARTVAIHRDEAGIDALLFPALVPADELARGGSAAWARQRAADFTRPRAPREPAALDRALNEALMRRASPR